MEDEEEEEEEGKCVYRWVWPAIATDDYETRRRRHLVRLGIAIRLCPALFRHAAGKRIGGYPHELELGRLVHPSAPDADFDFGLKELYQLWALVAGGHFEARYRQTAIGLDLVSNFLIFFWRLSYS